MSVDPLSGDYPWYTPYQFAGNKPIASVDIDGLEDIYYLDVYNVDGNEMSLGPIYIEDTESQVLEYRVRVHKSNGREPVGIEVSRAQFYALVDELDADLFLIDRTPSEFFSDMIERAVEAYNEWYEKSGKVPGSSPFDIQGEDGAFTNEEAILEQINLSGGDINNVLSKREETIDTIDENTIRVHQKFQGYIDDQGNWVLVTLKTDIDIKSGDTIAQDDPSISIISE